MKCDMDHMPTIGVMSQIMHMSMKHAAILFEQYDLKVGQAGILFALSHFGKISQKELAANLNVTPPSITAAIQKMEKLGFIIRQTDGKDQRIMRLELSEKGQDCLKHTVEVAKEMEQMVFKGMSQEEKMLFRRLLIQMKENLNQM